VASVSTQTTASKIALPQGKFEVSVRTLDLPGLLRCLVLSWSDQRAQLLLTAAENEAWQTVVCKDVHDYVRKLFQLDVPLTVVDLPGEGSANYGKLREAVTQSVHINDSLLIVCSVGGNPAEELWARQLGVWSYLPGANDRTGLETIFCEARKALAKQSIACVEIDRTRDKATTDCTGKPPQP